MNYLAHTWLARHSDDAILGGLLGDFVHGQVALLDWPQEVRQEILLHRRIDRFTDTHPAVTAVRADFGGLRRYAGIVLDVYFDHLLARDWSRWNDTPLPAFTDRVYGVLDEHHEQLPARLKRIAPHMAAEDWLGNYRIGRPATAAPPGRKRWVMSPNMRPAASVNSTAVVPGASRCIVISRPRSASWC